MATLTNVGNGPVANLFSAINSNNATILENALNDGSIKTAQLAKGAITGSKITLDSVFKELLLDYCYPVGSYYWTSASDNPHDLFGGTWEPINGKVLVGVDENDDDFDTPGNTGGEKTHTLTEDEMPSHTHTIPVSETEQNYLGGNSGRKVAKINIGSTETSSPAGGGAAHNNMPPYITAYCWRRTG